MNNQSINQSIIKAGALIVPLLFFAIATATAAPAPTGYSGTWKGQSAEAQFSDESGGGNVTAKYDLMAGKVRGRLAVRID